MKFKNAVFVDQKFMETVAKCNKYEDWEPKGAYWFNRLVKKLRSAQEDFNDTRNKMVTKYADDPDKDGIGYVNLPVKAQKPSEQLDYAKLSICLTALDNRRPILKNLVAKKPKHIINPLSFL